MAGQLDPASLHPKLAAEDERFHHGVHSDSDRQFLVCWDAGSGWVPSAQQCKHSYKCRSARYEREFSVLKGDGQDQFADDSRELFT